MGDAIRPCVSVNVSKNGVLVEGLDEIRVGSTVEVVIVSGFSGKEEVSIVGKVVRCVDTAGDDQLVGLKIEDRDKAWERLLLAA